ncbi:MAG TPA: type VI secretion system TssO [Panacibacter sp.]|nr:type VI secretion system TssO [Panacibacter sp.]
MRALNHKERNELFWQFFIVAFVTLAVLIWALEVDFHLPSKLNEKDISDLRDYRSFVHSQNKILNQMNEIDSLISGIESSNTPGVYYTNATVRIGKFKTLVASDTSQNTLINKMSDIFAKYADDKKRIKDIVDKKTEAESKLSQCNQELQNDKTEINRIRQAYFLATGNNP